MSARHLLVAATLAAFAVWTMANSAASAQRPDPRDRSGRHPNRPTQVHPRITPPSGVVHVPVHPSRPAHPVVVPDSWRRHADFARPLHRYPNAVVIERPVFVYPQAAYDTAVIRLVNPAFNGATMYYALDGQQYFLDPGGMQWLNHPCVVTFDSGSGGLARTVLTRGTYVFAQDAYGGWTLRRN